ncbi:MAG TPA: zf-HC2 domain-containing protein [Candidatus Binatia bacterium]|nr:zf-HC2 domain-containing protein [Candidatus Binatia bacterium]
MVQNRPAVTACETFEPDLVLYHYGELGGAERARVEAHLQHCEGCRGYLKETKAIAGLTLKADAPSQAFWDDYTREMRHKLAALDAQRSWWQRLAAAFQPWTIPAFATTAVVVLALALTLGQEYWRPTEAPPEQEALMEVLPLAENLEFYENMDMLDSMDLLEYMASSANRQV